MFKSETSTIKVLVLFLIIMNSYTKKERTRI